MALKLSTGLRDSLLGNAYLKGTSLSYVDGAVGNDYITDSENRFLTAGFKVGDLFSTTGSTTGANDLTNEPILAVAAGKLEFATGQVNTAEAFVAATDIEGDNEGSLRELFENGILHIYSGSQPADANSDEIGTKLVEITLASGAFTPGSATNGLEFEAPISGKIGKKASETWSGVGIADGTAGWFRLYDNLEHTGAVESAVRLDGNCGVSGAQLNMSSTSVKSGATVTLDSFDVTLPAS